MSKVGRITQLAAKPAGDWAIFVDSAKEATREVKSLGEQLVQDLDRAIRSATKRNPKWIPTHGADLSGHDFGCEWVWAVWTGCCPLRREDLSPSYFVVKRHGDRYLMLLRPGLGFEGDGWVWEYITHWMPSTIRTPEPPEGSA